MVSDKINRLTGVECSPFRKSTSALWRVYVFALAGCPASYLLSSNDQGTEVLRARINNANGLWRHGFI
jgi:hypothetical protein